MPAGRNQAENPPTNAAMISRKNRCHCHHREQLCSTPSGTTSRARRQLPRGRSGFRSRRFARSGHVFASEEDGLVVARAG
jgi:hypothetical protein